MGGPGVLGGIKTGFRTDLREEAAALRLPTLILHGDADASAPVALCGRRLAQLIPNNAYKEYPRAGHGIFMTHAAEVNQDLLEFIGSTSGAPSGIAAAVRG